MPRDSQFTDAVLNFMTRQDRPVTATEIQEEVGMSRQAAYQWLDSNAWRVKEVGKGRHGAKAYVVAGSGGGGGSGSGLPSNFKPRAAERVKPARSRAPVPNVLDRDTGDGGVPIERITRAVGALSYLGRTLTVVGMRLVEGGGIVIDVVDEEGQEIHCQVTIEEVWTDD